MKSERFGKKPIKGEGDLSKSRKDDGDLEMKSEGDLSSRGTVSRCTFLDVMTREKKLLLS